MPLSAEERARLEQDIPYFSQDPQYEYLAEKKLLPQQRHIASFENAPWYTKLRRTVYGLTGDEQRLIEQQEKALVPFLQEQKIIQEIQAKYTALAPTAEEAMGMFRGGQLPFAPTREQAQPIIPTPEEATMLQQRDLLQGPRRPEEQFQPLAAPVQPGQVLGIDPTAWNPQAKLTPFQTGTMEQALQKGETVLPGQIPIPTSLAVQAGKEAKAPSMSDENIISQELFGPGMTVDKLTTKEQFQQLSERLKETRHPVGIHKNAIAKLYGATNYDDLARNNTPLTQEEVTRLQQYSKDTGTPIVAKVGMPRLVAADATIYQRGIAFAGAGAAARATGELQQPAGPEAANYFDVASLQKGRLISASDKEPGITKLDLRQSKTYKFINPNDQQELQGLNNARNTLRELFARSEYILEPTDQLKATTIQPALIWALAKGGPGANDPVKDKAGNVIGTKGEIAKSFLDQLKSFGGVIARGVLAERGVLTDADREVAAGAGVNASDTIKTMKQKAAFFEQLMNFQFKAIARLSDNPTASVADLVKEKEALMKEAQKFPAAPAMPTAGATTAPFNDPEKERRYQEWKAKHK